MPFVKLDCGILNSTLWYDRGARDVFITALLMAEPFELLDPTPQIQVDSLEHTGWIVPAGWYGFVAAAGVGILHRAGIDDGSGMDALRALGNPELSSRTPDFEGRRLVRIDGGYIVLNFIKYRDKDMTAKDRQKRWRDRQRQREHNALHPHRNASQVTIAEAEAEAEAEVPQLATLAVPPAPVKTLTKPLAYKPRIDVAWPGRPNVPGGLHEEFVVMLGGDPEDARRRLREWYPNAAAPYDGVPIGDDPWKFWRLRFREWQGTTAKPLTSGVITATDDEIWADIEAQKALRVRR